MPSREVTIASASGLHARPANLFVQTVNRLGLRVTIQKEGRPPVDARSMLGVMTLGAKHGEVVTLAANGDGAEAALDTLVAFLTIDHDQPAA